MLEENYENTYGTWTVRTEGDVEGRTMNHLGTFTGHIDQIALYLANKCYYSLHFTLTEKVTRFVPTGDSVNVVLDIKSNTWNMDSDERVDKMSNAFKDRPVIIKNGQYFSSFKIISNDKEVAKKIKEAKKQEVLNKLSNEEKELLGLI